MAAGGAACCWSPRRRSRSAPRRAPRPRPPRPLHRQRQRPGRAGRRRPRSSRLCADRHGRRGGRAARRVRAARPSSAGGRREQLRGRWTGSRPAPPRTGRSPSTTRGADDEADDEGTTVTEPSQYVVEDGVTRTTTEETPDRRGRQARHRRPSAARASSAGCRRADRAGRPPVGARAQAGGDGVPDPRGQQRLRAGRQLRSRCRRRRAASRRCPAPRTPRPSPTALTTSRSQPLRASLARPWCSGVARRRRRSRRRSPTTTWPGSRAPTSSTRMSGLVVSGSGGGSAVALLDLVGGVRRRPEVGHRGGHHHGVGALDRGRASPPAAAAPSPTRTTSTAAGSPRSAVCAATRVTAAPRWAATRASA